MQGITHRWTICRGMPTCSVSLLRSALAWDAPSPAMGRDGGACSCLPGSWLQRRLGTHLAHGGWMDEGKREMGLWTLVVLVCLGVGQSCREWEGRDGQSEKGSPPSSVLLADDRGAGGARGARVDASIPIQLRCLHTIATYNTQYSAIFMHSRTRSLSRGVFPSPHAYCNWACHRRQPVDHPFRQSTRAMCDSTP